MSNQHQPMHDRLLATAIVARAIVLLAREINQCTSDVFYGEDHFINFKWLGVSDVDAVYIFARLAGNPVDPVVELAVAPCLVGSRCAAGQ